MKEIFVDIVTHDLINLAGPARNFALDCIAMSKNKVQRELLTQIYKANDKLVKLIYNASILSRLESAEKLKFEDKDLLIILNNAIDVNQGFASEKKININFPRGKFVAKVNVLFVEVFNNLISNALKYGKKGGQITIQFQNQGKNWKISIANLGEKVPNKYKEIIFTRFERLKQEGVKGTGLGLAIVSRVIKIHKGKVWVEDNPAGGSVFVFTIPKKQS